MVEDQTVFPAVQRERRLIADLRLQALHLLFREVRRVREDEVRFLDAERGRAVEQIALFQGEPLCPVAFHIAADDGARLVGFLDGDDFAVFEIPLDGDADTAAAGAEVQHSGGTSLRVELFQILQRDVHKQFRLRPRDEDPIPHGEREVVKVPFLQEILERIVFTSPTDEVEKPPGGLLLQLPVAM